VKPLSVSVEVRRRDWVVHDWRSKFAEYIK